MKYGVYQDYDRDNIKIWCGEGLPNKGVFTNLNEAYQYRETMADRWPLFTYCVEEMKKYGVKILDYPTKGNSGWCLSDDYRMDINEAHQWYQEWQTKNPQYTYQVEEKD